MKTFLQSVAQDLYSKIGNDLSRTAIVFPNKRASLFFNEYLAAQSDRPLWSPAYVNISELFRSLSPLKPGDPIRLVCELYKVFREETHSEEPLDDFYFWGELLISDFDDADKNLVDADKLFSNLQDLKNIMDDYDFLDQEQEEAIQQFFQNFSIDKRTQLKEKFISLWDKLGDIYRHYRKNLSELGIAYEGMMYRHVIEELDTDRLRYDRYVFVGFNVLNKVETHFFQRLQDAGKAMFYWDYDVFYTRLPHEQQPPYVHEAGEFILRNLKLFPNQLPETAFDVLRHPKKIRFISAPTENAQARYLPQWVRTVVKSDPEASKEKENAIVLCNEALLLPVLHSIPPEVENVNITMGFPLAQTPVYSYINALMELQTTGYRRDTGRYTYEAALAVLKHPYTRQLSATAEDLEKQLTKDNRFYPLPSELKKDAFLEQVFTPQNGTAAICRYLTELLREVAVIYRQEKDEEDIFNQLYRESLFKGYTLINRLLSLIENDGLSLHTDTLKRLMNRLLTATNIPFHGEPAIGMQVMGVLETRNLDFRNLIMLSLNEGQLPKAGGDSSFIPYNLRKAFGMTTIEHKNSVYAYYFYRLIQRAENITLLYNTASDGLNRGEMSRFMLQFLVESPHDISRQYLEAGQSPQQSLKIEIHKTDEVLQRMYNAYDIRRHPNALFSPSAQILLPLRCRTESSRRGKRRDRLRPVRNHLPPFRRAGIPGPHSQRKGDTPGRPGAVAPQRRKVAGIRRHRLQGRVFPCACRRATRIQRHTAYPLQSNRILSAAIAPQRPAVRPFPYGRHGTKSNGNPGDRDSFRNASAEYRRNDRPYGQQRRYPAHRGLQDGWHSQDSRKHRAVVYPCRQPSELHLPDFPVCCHYVPQARTEGSSIPAVHPPCGIRELLARYRDGRTAPAQSAGQQFCVL